MMAVKYYLTELTSWRVKDNLKDSDVVPKYQLIDYLFKDDDTTKYIEIENEPFEGTITIVDNYRGRSASGVYVLVEGHPYGEPFVANMSTDILTFLLKDTTMVKGVAKGWFTLAKRGANYFVVYNKEED